MVVISSIVLIICCLFAAILPYRQPQKLPDLARPLASLGALSCLFIALSAVISLFTSNNEDDAQAVVIIFDNLASYLALPLLSALVVSACSKRYLTKATWGRVSLVMLAIFEVCRRAEIGDIYSNMVAICTSLVIAACLIFWLKGNNKLLLTNIVTLTSYALASVVLSKMAATQYQNIVLYQCFLGLALVGITYNLSVAIAKIDNTISE